MATATLLSFTDVQKQSRLPRGMSPALRKFAPFVRCCQKGCLPSTPDPLALTRTSSRRDAIALLLQGAFLSVANSNARAVEGDYERSKGAEHAQIKNGLELKVLVHANMVPPWVGKQPLGKLAGPVLAYQGGHKSADSSLGILGCLVFGLLFLKEKQSRAACNSSLEDIQSRIKQADIELCLQTRSSLGYKLEEIQLENGLERDSSLNGALQSQLVNARSSITDGETQLKTKKDLTKLFRNQLNGLATLVKEAEGDCSVLLGLVDKQLFLQQQLEGELHSMDVDIQSKPKGIDTLKLSVVNQDEVNKQMVKKLLEVENSLDDVNNQVLDAEKTAQSLKHSLLVIDDLAESLVVDLQCTGAKNKKLEGELRDLLTCLECERGAFARQLEEQNENLTLKEKEAEAWSTELLGLQNEIEGHMRMINRLATSERAELRIAVRMKKADVESLMEKIRSTQERLQTFNSEVATLHKQLLHEQACRAALESDIENNELLGLLSKVSSEVENQIHEQKGATKLLEDELYMSNQAWSASKAEISELRCEMESLLSSQVHLQKDMANLSEDKQATSHALKKEKRAAAYVKKQLALSKETIAEERRVTEELCNELEKARRLVADSKQQISVKVLELKRALETEDHLTEDTVRMRPSSSEEQALQMNQRGDDDVLASVGKRRRNLTKQTAMKVQRNSRRSLL